MRIIVVVVVLLGLAYLAQAGCPSGQYCGYCGCDAMYGPGYTCRYSSDHTCCWGNNYYNNVDSAVVCGNNVTECEPCDDGNKVSGDGCSSTCTVEAGWNCVIQLTQNSVCTPVCSSGCGNGTCVSPNTCKCNPGYVGATCNVSLAHGPTTCSGSGISCRYCGCDAMYGAGWTCRTSTDHTCCWGNNYYDAAPSYGFYCGNGVNECEPCDDGNTVNGDGCSSICTIESGYSCYTDNTQKSICTFTCSPACGAQGNCTGPNKCTCNPGYGGPQCTIALSPAPSTCSGPQNIVFPTNLAATLVPPATSGANPTLVVQALGSNDPNQQWNFVGGYVYSASPSYTNYVWDVKGAGTADNTRVILWPKKTPAAINEQWILVNGALKNNVTAATIYATTFNGTVVVNRTPAQPGFTNTVTCRYCGCDAMYGPGWTCRTPTDHTCCWGNNYYDAAPATGLFCGNGVNECEPCDDGNTVNGDGCSSTCQIEAGWSCSVNNTQISYCVPVNKCLIPSMNPCSAYATCTNGATVTCTCNAGYIGDGHTCVENECVTGNNNCGFYQTCSKTGTAPYTCVRKTGVWYSFDNGTPGGAGCTNSTSDAYWCMQPFNATRQQYIELPNFQIPANGYSVEAKWLARLPTVGGWTRVFEFGVGPDNDNVLLGTYGNNAGLTYRVYFGGSLGASLTANTMTPYTFGTIARVFLSHSPDTSIIVATNQSSNMNDVLAYPNNVNRTMNYIGRSLYASDSYLSGAVGEVRIWSTARSFGLYNTYRELFLNPYTTYPGLFALYQADKVCGNYWIDLTGNGRHAIMQNFVAADLFPSCYGRGTCSAATKCVCQTGYSGIACEKSA